MGGWDLCKDPWGGSWDVRVTWAIIKDGEFTVLVQQGPPDDGNFSLLFS